MKKFVYFLIIVIILWLGWMFLNNSKSTSNIPAKTPVVIDSPYFKVGMSATLGSYLADSNGMTLYTFSQDSLRNSVCTGACLVKWPAYVPQTTNLSALPENVGTITRVDGTMQFTWKDMPLYFYSGDKAAGDTTGQGFGGFWYVVNL